MSQEPPGGRACRRKSSPSTCRDWPVPHVLAIMQPDGIALSVILELGPSRHRRALFSGISGRAPLREGRVWTARGDGMRARNGRNPPHSDIAMRNKLRIVTNIYFTHQCTTKQTPPSIEKRRNKIVSRAGLRPSRNRGGNNSSTRPATPQLGCSRPTALAPAPISSSSGPWRRAAIASPRAAAAPPPRPPPASTPYRCGCRQRQAPATRTSSQRSRSP